MIKIFSQFKWCVIAVLILAVGTYINYLQNAVSTAKSDNLTLSSQLADSKAAEITLTNTIDDVNASLDRAHDELSRRDNIASNTIENNKRLDSVVEKQLEQHTKLKDENEEYKNWNLQPVPDAVGELLNSSRDSLQNNS